MNRPRTTRPTATTAPRRAPGRRCGLVAPAGPSDDVSIASLIESAAGLAIRFAGNRPHDAPPNPFETAAAALPEGGIWTGPLDALLDAWTSTRGYAWTYKPDRRLITVARSLAAVFRINALAVYSVQYSDAAQYELGIGGVLSHALGTSIISVVPGDPGFEVTLDARR